MHVYKNRAPSSNRYLLDNLACTCKPYPWGKTFTANEHDEEVA